MPAKSEVQQGAAGAALAAKRGEMPVSKLYGASKEMYKGMSGGQLRHFAKTKHKGLPHKKSLMSMNSHGQMNSVGYPHPKACMNNMEAMEDDLGGPVTGPVTIEFVRDVEALVQGGVFGSVDEEYFEKGTTMVVKSVVQEAPPNSDMARIIMEDGRLLIISGEDFEVVPTLESSASQIVSKLLDEEVPGEERLEVRAARNIMDAAHNLQSSLPEMTPEQGQALHTIMREANALIRMHR